MRLLSMVLATALLLVGGVAHGATISTSGTFSEGAGNTNQELSFSGSSVNFGGGWFFGSTMTFNGGLAAVGPGQEFGLGTLVWTNLYDATSSSVDLDVDLSINSEAAGTQTYGLNIQVDWTTRRGKELDSIWAEVSTLTGTGTESFTVDGVTYELEFLGFTGATGVSAWDANSATLSDLSTAELTLGAKLVSATAASNPGPGGATGVPELDGAALPAAGTMLIGAGLVMSGARRRQA